MLVEAEAAGHLRRAGRPLREGLAAAAGAGRTPRGAGHHQPARKSAFPENHPLALGSGGRAIPKPVHHFLAHADVIFGIGCSFAATTTACRTAGKTIIHATLDPADFNHTVPVDYALAGDAALTLDALLCEVQERLGGSVRGRFDAVAGEIASVRSDWLDSWQPKLSSDECRSPPTA